MVTDEEISEAIESLFNNNNNYNYNSDNSLSTLNGVVRQLELKLGLDLSHKLDFIRAQIRLLFLPQQQPPPPPPKDHFAPHQNPNFQPAPSSSAFQIFATHPQPPPPPKPEAEAEAAASHPPPTVVSAQTKPAKRKGGPGGLNKLCGVSPELQTIVGQPELPRTEIVKQLWAYIRKHNLQDPSNKRKIICNDELRLVFETDCTDMFKMNKLLAKHIISLEPTKQSGSKKSKVDVESAMRSSDPGPSVIISEALANFFGVGEREMLQSEVLRRIWEYIKLNNLEDPASPMEILCDAKFQELFGSESISALGIPEVLTRHHIFRKS
jgi:upstream activation factor subunit UAF30|uniref:DM2 domain-containing protein n=1 Tax=Fagus sylvatica TaxID=28930 RepID=A0A2N9HX00_FAGSY